MRINNQKRPPPEYISKLAELHKVWNRENEDANRLVFADLDIILAHAMKDAFDGGYFEAFAHLEKLRERIKVGYAADMAKELELIRKLPTE